MEHQEPAPMTPFDQLISNQTLQMIKLLIPYTSPETQRFLAVYVKFSELTYTLNFFQNFKRELQAQDFEKKSISPLEIIQEIRPYLPSQTSETLDTIVNMISMMELFDTFRGNSANGEDTDSGFNPMSMIKNMLTPEQQDMFDMYNTMFSQNNFEADSETEGGDSHD